MLERGARVDEKAREKSKVKNQKPQGQDSAQNAKIFLPLNLSNDMKTKDIINF
jgi:hypothetical protein